jgi:hypothetical protein
MDQSFLMLSTTVGKSCLLQSLKYLLNLLNINSIISFWIVHDKIKEHLSIIM